jgi:hypothetical protein
LIRSERLVGASNSSERLVGASNKQGEINQEPLLLLFEAPKPRSASRLLLLTGGRGLSGTLEQEQRLGASTRSEITVMGARREVVVVIATIPSS